MSVYPRGSGGIKDQLSKAAVKVAGGGGGCQPATPTLQLLPGIAPVVICRRFCHLMLCIAQTMLSEDNRLSVGLLQSGIVSKRLDVSS